MRKRDCVCTGNGVSCSEPPALAFSAWPCSQCVFYSRSALLWPLAFCSAYVLILLGIYQIVLWTLAVAEPGRPLRASAREAALLVARRPGTALLLGLALLLVNAVGVAAAVMPFLTLTIAYTFIAAAHFALPRPSSEPRH